MISDARALALCSFEGPRERSLTVSGGYSEGETPLPIPNRAVKPLSADGTWLERAWESRSPPVFPHEAGRKPPGLLHARGAFSGREVLAHLTGASGPILGAIRSRLTVQFEDLGRGETVRSEASCVRLALPRCTTSSSSSAVTRRRSRC